MVLASRWKTFGRASLLSMFHVEQFRLHLDQQRTMFHVEHWTAQEALPHGVS
jgi:hypothetical protein